MMSRRITLTLATATLATILLGVIAFALTTNEPTPVSAPTPATANIDADDGGDSAPEDVESPATTDDAAPESPNPGDPATPTSEASAVEPVAVDGAAIYATQCASCHGTSGQGGSGGPVDDLDITLAEVIGVTADGVPRMPAYADVLTPEEIAAVAEYTLTLGDN